MNHWMTTPDDKQVVIEPSPACMITPGVAEQKARVPVAPTVIGSAVDV